MMILINITLNRCFPVQPLRWAHIRLFFFIMLFCMFSLPVTLASANNEIDLFNMPLDELFTISEVYIQLDACDMPGPTRFKAVCQQCGQLVRDKKEILQNNRTLCRSCAWGNRFQPIKTKGKGHAK